MSASRDNFLWPSQTVKLPGTIFATSRTHAFTCEPCVSNAVLQRGVPTEAVFLRHDLRRHARSITLTTRIERSFLLEMNRGLTMARFLPMSAKVSGDPVPGICNARRGHAQVKAWAGICVGSDTPHQGSSSRPKKDRCHDRSHSLFRTGRPRPETREAENRTCLWNLDH